jgi:hypothetical protein
MRGRGSNFTASRKGPTAEKTFLGFTKRAEFLDQLSVCQLVKEDYGPLAAVGHLFKVEENYYDIISEDDAVQTE